MGKRLTLLEQGENDIAVIKYKNRNDIEGLFTTRVQVLDEKDDLIFNDNITVLIAHNHDDNKVQIIWEDSNDVKDFHDLGVFGYYSTAYVKIRDMVNSLHIYSIDCGKRTIIINDI